MPVLVCHGHQSDNDDDDKDDDGGHHDDDGRDDDGHGGLVGRSLKIFASSGARSLAVRHTRPSHKPCSAMHPL